MKFKKLSSKVHKTLKKDHDAVDPRKLDKLYRALKRKRRRYRARVKDVSLDSDIRLRTKTRLEVLDKQIRKLERHRKFDPDSLAGR